MTHRNGHESFIHDSQKLETTQNSIHNKETNYGITTQ